MVVEGLDEDMSPKPTSLLYEDAIFWESAISRALSKDSIHSADEARPMSVLLAPLGSSKV